MRRENDSAGKRPKGKNTSLARLVRDLRDQHGWSQQEMGDLISTSRDYIASLEGGEVQRPSNEVLRALERLGIPTADLLFACGIIDQEMYGIVRGAHVQLPEARTYLERRYPGRREDEYRAMAEMIEVLFGDRRASQEGRPN